MSSQTTNRGVSGPFPCQDEMLDLFELLVNVMFCMKNTDSVYVAVNAAFVRRTGKTSKRDVIGRRASDLFRPELAERYEEQDRRVFATGESLRDRLELIRRHDGELGWYLTTKVPVSVLGEPSVLAGLVSISRDLRIPSEEQIGMESLMSVVDFVNDHLDGPLRVSDLAAAANCSTGQLERRMKQVFGLTPTQYVLRVRVDRAATLLTESPRSLADIATAVGFYDQADFTRRFARLTNETPAQFRSSHGAT